MTQLVSVPLETLSLSRHNIRRTGRDTNIEQLATSILADGLLQNLTVARIPPQEDQPAERYEVIAGGRRLRALQLLDERGDLPDLLRQIPVNIVAPELANEVGLAENTIREGMHPHDEFVAFRDLAAAGKSIEEIAQRFGVTPLVVQRRLRLANVAPEILKAFRENAVGLDVMMAFALTDDWKAQLRIFEETVRNGRRLNADQVRLAIAQKQVPTSDPRVRFAGLATYEAAGGAVLRDLFDDAGGGYVADETLLDQLVEERLLRERDALLLEGWKFVHIERNGEAWRLTGKCDRTEPKRTARELTAEQEARLQVIEDRLDAIQGEKDAAEEADEYDFALADRLDAENDALKLERASLREPIEEYSDRQRAKSGVLIQVGRAGELEAIRGLIPREGSKAEVAANQARAEATGEKPEPKTPTLAEAMIRRLTAHRTLALQAALLQRRDVALKALAHALLLPLLYPNDFETRSALEVSAKNEHGGLSSFHFQDVDNSPVMVKLAADIAELRVTLNLPPQRAKLWPWLLQQSEEPVLALLGLVAVLSLNATSGAIGEHPSDALAAALAIDYADYWQATPDAFTNLVPKALFLEALGEVADEETRRRFSTRNDPKDVLAAEVSRELVRLRWLPKPLRRPGYKPGVAKAPAAANAPKKAPDSKPAAKPKAAPATKAKKPAAKKAAAKKTPPKKSAPTKRK